MTGSSRTLTPLCRFYAFFISGRTSCVGEKLATESESIEEISYNKHYLHGIFRHGIVDLLSLKITIIIYGAPSR